MLEKFIIGRILQELPFSPNEGQNAVIERLGRFLISTCSEKLFLLRGYAGTGKTSLVSALVRALHSLQQPCVLLAPTGRAAKVLSHYSGSPAYTIHKFIYRQERMGVESFGIADNRLRHTLFIVDEGSMVSAQRDNPTFGTGCLLDDLVHFVYSGDGCSLLILGDDAQLPPVGQSESMALNADYLRGYGLEVTDACLTEVARQALDSGILSNATTIRNQLAERAQSYTSDTQSIESLLTDYKDIYHLNGSELVEQLERSYQQVGVEETLILTRSNKRTNLYNSGIRSRILWREDALSTGDRLMVSKNNYFWTEQYDNLPFLANGDMFEIVRTRNERELYGFHFIDISLRALDYDWEIDTILWLDTLTTDSPEHNYQLQKQLFAKITEDYPEIHNQRELWKTIMASPYYNALQARFAYAVTCHKAQGGQWKHVYIDPGNVPAEEQDDDFLRWYYTAITRSTEQVYLLGNR